MELDHDGNSIPEASLKQLDSVGSAEICDPRTESRVGNEYQVEIPPMITNPYDSQVMSDASRMFLIGLPIPIVWVLDGSEDDKRGLKCNLGNEVSVGGGNVINLKRKSSEHENDTIPVNLELRNFKSFSPLPGSVSEPWSDADEKSFLLGLYIYGKNFVRVMKFMDNKEMGELLSFYYGKFYKSDGYRRWSSSRNTRSRKCVTGHKIFTGWRQQELISRLLPHVPEESQKNLVEVSKAFAEGNTSLDVYVSFLKSTVGIQIFVEAVGIGKGKEDLTGLAIDSVKTKQHFPVCPKIPTGQACSSLTPSEIIKFLTGGYRLSKARCNDIFWEAVWPRLLARGWHSEQPKNQGYATSFKDLLVYLMPGVHKFSRRKLVKGIHYFDSVTDVLSKVVSEPELLELETEETRVSCRSEEENMQQDGLSDDQRRYYLKPQISTCNANHIKFTVVDTSLARELKSSNIIELRPLPHEFKSSFKDKRNCSEESKDETDLDSSDKPSNGEKKTVISNPRKGLDRLKFTVGRKTSQFGVLRYSPIGLTSQLVSLEREKFVDKHEPEAANMASDGKKSISDGGLLYKFTVVDTSGGKYRELRYLPVDLTSRITRLVEDLGNSSEDSLDKHDLATSDIMLLNCKKNVNHYKSISYGCGSSRNAEVCGNKMENQSTSDVKQAKASIKYQFSRGTKCGDLSSVAHPTKRRRLAACVKVETNRVAKISSGGETKEVKSCCALADAGNNGPSKKLASVSCSAEDKPLIDLNLPLYPADCKSSDSLKMSKNECENGNEEWSVCKTERVGDSSEESGNMKSRRQSTRKRPLTTKAIEALANGFLNRSEDSSSSRRARSRIKY